MGKIMRNIARRTILKGLKALGLFIAAPISFCAEAFADRFPTRTVEIRDFSFDPQTGMIRREKGGKTEPYKLIIDGLVEKPVTLSYAELTSLPAASQVSDFHCVEGWTISQVGWSGLRFAELAKLVKPREDPKYAVFHAMGKTFGTPGGVDHYIESFRVDDLLDPDQEILLAFEKDGKPLAQERGAPLRVIAPFRFAYKSIKFVHRVEFSNKRRDGWWTLANSIYSWDALVPKRRLRQR